MWVSKSLYITLCYIVLISLLNFVNAEELDGDTKIIGGSTVAPGETHAFKWLVNFIPNPSNPQQFCGGAILNKDWVLTAGHCVNQTKDTLNITVGDVHLYAVDTYEATVSSHTIVLHPQYAIDPGTHQGVYENDLALILLETPITMNEGVQAINLPPSTFNVSSVVSVAGWGRSSYNDPSQPALLKYTEVGVIPTSQCLGYYLASGHKINDDVICTRTVTGSGPCTGDEGGPLVCKVGNTDYVCGIVSFVGQCTPISLPILNAKVTSHLDWIAEVMRTVTRDGSNSSTAQIASFTLIVVQLLLLLFR